MRSAATIPPRPDGSWPRCREAPRSPAPGADGGVSLIWEGLARAVALVLGADPEILAITWLSLQVSGAATLLSLLVGLPAGTLLALTRFPGRGLVVAAVNTGMGLPPVVVGLFISIL